MCMDMVAGIHDYELGKKACKLFNPTQRWCKRCLHLMTLCGFPITSSTQAGISKEDKRWLTLLKLLRRPPFGPAPVWAKVTIRIMWRIVTT